MGSIGITDKTILKEIRSLDDDKKREVLDFIRFLKDRKKAKKHVKWEDIIGVTEFETDASVNHDKYLNDTI